jgi:hypothetical protein
LAPNFGGNMAKTFADKTKQKKKVAAGVNVKFIKSVKTDKNTVKFNERFVRIDDISKVTELK